LVDFLQKKNRLETGFKDNNENVMQ